jgi:hypothetical protein
MFPFNRSVSDHQVKIAGRTAAATDQGMRLNEARYPHPAPQPYLWFAATNATIPYADAYNGRRVVSGAECVVLEGYRMSSLGHACAAVLPSGQIVPFPALVPPPAPVARVHVARCQGAWVEEHIDGWYVRFRAWTAGQRTRDEVHGPMDDEAAAKQLAATWR